MYGPSDRIGAGVAGLSAALEIESLDCREVMLIEKSDRVGGQLRTDLILEKCRLDLGFQILLPEYPEIKKFGDIGRIEPRHFNSGARIELPYKPRIIANPIKHPQFMIETLGAPFLNSKDMPLLISTLANSIFTREGLQHSSQSTISFIKEHGFSSDFINCFWRPFLSGIFLDGKLETTSSFFKFLLPIFARSQVAVPGLGIDQFP